MNPEHAAYIIIAATAVVAMLATLALAVWEAVERRIHNHD